MENFDIVYLCETHLMEYTNSIMNLFRKKFITATTNAIKIKKFGRGKGGEILLFKRNLKNFCEIKRSEWGIYLTIKWKNEEFVIIPIYLNCNSWMNDFERFSNLLTKINSCNIMVIGDWNAHLAASQIFTEDQIEAIEIVRNSKDKAFDSKGRKILEKLQEYNLIIKNGCSKSDKEGDYTFIGAQGCSVIDFCAVSGLWSGFFDDLRVDRMNISEHMPLNISIRLDIPRARLGTKSFYIPLNKVKCYKSQLANKCRKIQVSDVEITANTMIEAMRDANPRTPNKSFSPKNKWYDWKCEKLRKESLFWLNAFRRSDNPEDKKRYIEVNKKYKITCRNKKTSYEEEVASSLINVKSSKEFWKKIQNINGITANRPLSVDLGEMANHFQSVLNNDGTNAYDYSIPLEISLAPRHPVEELITLEEIKNQLAKMKSGKAPGPDRVTVDMFRLAPGEFIELLLKFYNVVWAEGRTPQNFRNAILVPIFKKGDPTEPGNYRGISLQNVLGKIFCGIVLSRLQRYVEEESLLKEQQAGFRAGYSAMDQIFTLTSIAEIQKKRGRNLCVTFIDFKSAFDTVNREALFYKLVRMGVPITLMGLIKSLYSNTCTQITDGVDYSERFPSARGVRQGCVLSPLLFSLFMNDFDELMPGGVEVRGTKIKCLLYADDIAILSESEDMMQIMLNRTHDYCQKWDLQVNTSKTKTMIFSKKFRKNPKKKFFIDRERIEIVKNFKYLGITITPQLSYSDHIAQKRKEATSALAQTWRRVMSSNVLDIRSKKKVYEATVESVALYGAQVWGGRRYEDLEKVPRFFFKRLFKLPQNTPSYALAIELETEEIFLKSLSIHVQYILKILEQSPGRWTRLVVEELKYRNCGAVRSLCELAGSVGVNLSFDQSVELLREDFECLQRRLKSGNIVTSRRLARESLSRLIYSSLDLDRPNYWMDEQLTSGQKRLIFMARTELLDLEYAPYKEGESSSCTICNTGHREDILHLLGKCPVLGEFRSGFLGARSLGLEEVRSFLNGRHGWRNVAEFLETTLAYRTEIYEFL